VPIVEPDDPLADDARAPLDEAPADTTHVDANAVDDDDSFDDDSFDDDGPTDEGPRRIHGTVGTALGAAMVGLDAVIFGRQREEAPIVITASGEPGDVDSDGIVIPLDDEADIVAPPLPQTPPVVAPRRRRRLW